MSEEKHIAVIGRGESILAPDEEAANSAEKEAESIELLKESAGLMFPKIKLSSWDPENEKQWDAIGSAIARRNLIASIPNLTCAFGVWLVWSVIATKIQKMHDEDPNVYPFEDWGSPTGSEYKATLFLLPATAGLSGGTMRIPNSFLTQVAGGRNVVYSTSVILCLPMIMAGIALSNPDCSFVLLLIAAMLSGAGGGAFASSMSNISFYYPKRLQGYSLGMNGGLGNLGVSITQLLAPIFMSNGFFKDPISPAGIAGWPNNAGWLWFPICAFSSVLAFFWMSNQPNHGSKSQLISHLNFYWMEGMGFVASGVGVLTLVYTRDAKILDNPAGQVLHKFILVILCLVLEHLFIWFITPKKAKVRVHKQVEIFKDKHTYVMTWLYIMCFGSFIGYSGSFPKLIVDLFGYINGDGCLVGNDFTPDESMDDCLARGGEFMEDYEYTNPNAPSSAKFAWLGAFVGSLIRPIGGVMADKYGGAKVTMVAIVFCTAAAFAQGILVKKTRELEKPEENFGWFLFLFLILFLTTGTMNGTTFRTIGVLFPPEQSGPVLGWSSAVASYGAFIIPVMFGIALKAGKPETTFYCLGGYYVSCGILNVWYYLRPGCEKPGV